MRLTVQNKFLENNISINATTEQTIDYSTVIRQEWLEMMKPMIYKRLEWAVDQIFNYDVLWLEYHHVENTKL